MYKPNDLTVYRTVRSFFARFNMINTRNVFRQKHLHIFDIFDIIDIYRKYRLSRLHI